MKHALVIALAVLAAPACKKDAKKTDTPPAPAPTDTTKPADTTKPGDMTKPVDPPADPVKPADPGPGDEWKPFTSAEGGFSVKFPGTPQEQTQDLGVIKIHIAALDLGNAAYLAGWQVQPKDASKDPKEVLDGAQSGMLSSFPGAKVLDQKDIKLDGKYPGRELTVKLAEPDATQFSRYYLVGDHLYQLAALGEGAGEPAKAKIYLDSFELTKK